MKKIILFLLSLLILSSSQIYSQSGWVKQHPKWAPIPKGDVYSAQIFGNNIYATSSGYFLRSTNAGQDWYSPNYGADMVSSFINSTTGFSSGDSVYKTIDGGRNWTMIHRTIGFCNGFKFLNQNKGLAVGYGGLVPLTVNGGITWEFVQTPVGHALWTIDMLDENIGLVGSDSGRIMRTSNGGHNWNIVAHFPSVSIRGIAFASPQIVVAVGERNAPVMRSTNGGLNWTTLAPLPETFVRFVDFIDAQTGFASSYGGELYRTADAGLTWSLYSDAPVGNVYSFHFSDANKWIGCGNGLALTTNAGQSWDSLPDRGITQANFWDVDMVTENIIVAVGDSSRIIHSNDGGMTWTKRISNLGTTRLHQVAFGNANTGWISGQYGRFLKSTDGGLNWTLQNIGINVDINSISFLDELNGLVLASNGTILRTTNGGSTWSSSFSNQISSVKLVSNNIAYGGGANIHKSTDGGITWTLLSTPVNYLGNLNFFDENTGYALRNGDVIKTINGGLSWAVYNIPQITETVQSMEFGNVNTGFITGVNGLLLRTTNGGQNWTREYTGIAKNRLRAVSMYNNNIGVVAGEYGLVMKTTTGGTTGISNISTEIPSDFMLHQNYPNPFNPSTSIKFDIPQSGYTSLKVFDLSGRMISELVRQDIQAGTYSYEFSGAGLSSGIYFYVLRSGDHYEARKMVLIK